MRNVVLFAGVATLALAAATQAAVYSGNGDTSFGGAVGGGSLQLTDDGTTITGTLTKGAGNFSDVLVIYVDSTTGGISTDTSSLADANDGLRRAISGYDGTNRSTLSFPAGFVPDYAIAIGPSADNFAATFGLAAGGNNSLVYDNTYSNANVSNTGSNSATTYTFTVDHRALGLAVGQQATIKLLGTYIANSAYRSTEAIAGNVTGAASGYGSFTGASTASFTTVPEPASLAVLGLGAAGLLRRRK